MDISYPLSFSDYRHLPTDYRGNVFVWDVDKTYLSTHFSSMVGLAKIPVEFAVDKKAIPGMPEVLRGIRRGPGPEYEGIPLYFISASPPFLRQVVEHKMLLDGVEQDGITFKDWIATLIQLRPGRLFEQVGYKVCALLAGRRHRILAKEYLFGDDTEKDAEAFNIYANFINGSLSFADLESALEMAKVAPDDIQSAMEMADQLPEKFGSVKKIFIHLEQNTNPKIFRDYGNLLLPVKGSFQMALALYELKLVDAETAVAARKAVTRLKKYKFSHVDQLAHDAEKRGLISATKLKRLEKLWRSKKVG